MTRNGKCKCIYMISNIQIWYLDLVSKHSVTPVLPQFRFICNFVWDGWESQTVSDRCNVS